MKLRCLVLACAVGSSWQARAVACSVVLPQQQSLSCEASPGGGAHTSVAGARLQLDAVEIQRSRYAPPGKGDCGELGSTRLRLHLEQHLEQQPEQAAAAGSSTWPADVGLLLTLREGKSNYFAPPLTTVADVSGWLLLPQSGAVRLFGPEDPRVPLALRLEARAVDCAGAVSAPLEVRIEHPGRSDAGPAEPAAEATPMVPEGAAPEGAAAPAADAAVQASRPAPGASCAVCSVRASAPGGKGHGLWLALGALLLIRRRRHS